MIWTFYIEMKSHFNSDIAMLVVLKMIRINYWETKDKSKLVSSDIVIDFHRRQGATFYMGFFFVYFWSSLNKHYNLYYKFQLKNVHPEYRGRVQTYNL